MAEDNITYPNSADVAAGDTATEDHYNNLRKDAAIKYVQLVVFDFDVSWAVGDGKYYFEAPKILAGMKLNSLHARVTVPGDTGTSDIQIHHISSTFDDMLSTKLTIDSGEYGSNTADSPAVINQSYNTMLTFSLLRVDIDAISTTPPKGLMLTLGFEPA